MDILFRSSPIWALSGIAAVTLGVVVNRRRNVVPLPPGPPGPPILGNALQIPPQQQWLAFSQWAKQYGDLIYLSALGKTFVVLHSQKLIMDLIEKRGNVYSDRPRYIMCELVGFPRSLPMCHFGTSVFREARTICTTLLGPRKVREVYPLLQDKARRFASRLLESPDALHSHVRWITTDVTYTLSYGHPIEGLDDPIVLLSEKVMDSLSACLKPGAWLVDIFPILLYVPAWFPGAKFKVLAKQWDALGKRLHSEPFNIVKSEVAQGTAPPSFAATLLQQNDVWTEEEEKAWEYVTAAIYAGGSETSSCALYTFFLAMTLYPDVQRKAKEELDRLLGRGPRLRLPTVEDRANLPYLDATLKEVYRWNSVAPLGIPHASTEDDVYDGQFIPKGTMVIVNVWHIMQNPSIYPDPSVFKPDRFLPENSHGNVNPDPRGVIFGTGRRACPGQPLAEASLFVLIATTLALFDIASPLNSDGHPITTEAKFLTELVSHPMPFECKITPRLSASEIKKLIL